MLFVAVKHKDTVEQVTVYKRENMEAVYLQD
jgi:hypothetical protein